MLGARVTESALGEGRGEVVLLQVGPGAVPGPTHCLTEHRAGQPGAQGGGGHHLFPSPRGGQVREHHGPGLAQLVRHVLGGDHGRAVRGLGVAEVGGPADPQAARSAGGGAGLMVRDQGAQAVQMPNIALL